MAGSMSDRRIASLRRTGSGAGRSKRHAYLFGHTSVTAQSTTVTVTSTGSASSAARTTRGSSDEPLPRLGDRAQGARRTSRRTRPRRGHDPLEAHALPLPAARARTEARSPDRARPLAKRHRPGPAEAVPRPGRSDGAARSTSTAATPATCHRPAPSTSCGYRPHVEQLGLHWTSECGQHHRLTTSPT